MNTLNKMKQLYWKLRVDFPIWLDSRMPRPYLKLWKHYLARSEKAKRAAIMRLYELTFGYEFDWEAPQTFNEKIQWLKLYGDLPLMTRLADKYLVREYVREKIGEKYLVPLLGVWDTAEEVDFDPLPQQFILKANHGSGMNLIVTDKSALDLKAARKKLKAWLKENFAWYFMELQYRDIPPKIIAEKYLENENGDLYDYKIWCFDGKPKFIQFLSDRQTGLKMAFYDLDWKKLDFTYNYPKNEKEVQRPDNLDELLEKAEILAQGFPHVRVDFYRLSDGELKFGEMTFSAMSGFCLWNPREMDSELGKLFSVKN